MDRDSVFFFNYYLPFDCRVKLIYHDMLVITIMVKCKERTLKWKPIININTINSFNQIEKCDMIIVIFVQFNYFNWIL